MAALVLLLVLAGTVIWAAVTEQRIDLTESRALAELDSGTWMQAGGLTVSVVEQSRGPIPVVLLHDVDIAGGIVFDGVVAELPGRFSATVIDLPGFGLSERIISAGDGHTVAALADVVSAVMDQRLSVPAVVVGVGLGGEVASQLAVSHPEQLRGLVLVDVDFWDEGEWYVQAGDLPYFGRPITFTFEAGGALGVDTWAPYCEDGGWCPTAEEVAARRLAASVRGTTDSIMAHHQTLPSSLVPSDLSVIGVPVVYVWSTAGGVPRETVDRLLEALPDMAVIESETWQAHLDNPASVGEAIEVVSP